MTVGLTPDPAEGSGSAAPEGGAGATDQVLDLRPSPVIGALVGAHWRGYTLDRVSLPGADLRRLFVEGSSLIAADLTHCSLQRAHVVDSRLLGAALGDARLDDAVLVNVDLQGADLRGASLRSAVLVFCDLRHARLDRADLRDTVWSHTDLRGTDLSGCMLEGARGDFFWDDTTRWPASFTL